MKDAIVSDTLNDASIIDRVRLCKARRYRFANGDMAALEESLKQAQTEGARITVIATDGLFHGLGISPICRASRRWRKNIRGW